MTSLRSVSIDDRLVPINMREYARIREMAVREPYLAGALNRLCRAITVTEMEFPIDSLTEIEVHDSVRDVLRQRIVQEYWAPLATEYVRSKYMFGFFVYQLTRRSFEVSEDGKHVRFGPPKSRDEGVVVPTIPDPSTYRVYVGLDPQREKQIVCKLIENDYFEEGAIEVIFTNANLAPDAVTGNMFSPLASLIGMYESYALYEQCELQAVFASTNLPVVYQPVPQKEISTGSGTEVPIADARLMGISENGEPPTVTMYNAATDLAMKQIQDNENRAGPGERVRVGLTHERAVVLHDAMQGPTHFVPMDKTIASNVPVPSVPTGLNARFEMYRSQISVALGIPASFLGSPMGSNFSANADIDSGEFVATLNSVTRDVEFAMGEIYNKAALRMGSFKIPFFAMQPIERVREYFSIGAIDHKRVRETVFRMSGLGVANHDTRETEMPIEGYIAKKRLELDQQKTTDTHRVTDAQLKTMAADVQVKHAQVEAQTAAAKESAANAAAAKRQR